MDKLLSIAIPTKNRQDFLIPLLKLLLTFDLKDIEIVIQDNSDDEKIIQEFLDKNPSDSIKYFHIKGQYSQMENSEFALEKCNGKYICFLGDDDYLSRYFIEIVRCMDKYGIECCIFNKADYVWPGVKHKGFDLSNLTMPRFRGIIRNVDVNKEFSKIIKHGAIRLYHTPQVYHSILLKSKLEDVKKIAGVYIPGPSPDMALATALCSVVEKMIICDVPFVTSGKSIKSAGALGLQHEHKGELGKIKMLPSDIEDRWLNSVPKIWTGPTIYAQSCNEALKAMGNEDGIRRFNWNYFYAYFLVSFKEYRTFLEDAISQCEAYNKKAFAINVIRAFIEKCLYYFKIRYCTKYKCIKKDELPTVYEAGLFSDDILSDVNVEDLFHAYKSK